MKLKVGVIGSGFAGLSTAAVLAKAGFEVHVFEKNATLGGRARVFEAEGFTFDMGPSWYWMPEVFEDFYQHFGHTSSDFYQLERLDPSYKVVFGKGDEVDLPADFESLCALFESIEKGSAEKLKSFLVEAEYKYKTGMEEFVWKPGESITEFMDWKVVSAFFKLDMITSLSSQVRKLFTNDKLIRILEFPVLFLGATPQKTPALYSLMNYADIKLGTWYPMGGMFKIIEAFTEIGRKQGVIFHADAEVTSIVTRDNVVNAIETKAGRFELDALIAGADYKHVDTELLPQHKRNYSDRYWDSRVLAPSSLLYYLGIDKKLSGLEHHNLFFDADFGAHAEEIYTTHKWPNKPLFYACMPSKTDASVAPAGCENMFVLIPVSTELTGDTETIRQNYLDLVLERLYRIKGIDLSGHIIYQRSYGISDFKSDYHAFKGNAYGLANILGQTAILKPALRAKKLSNMYFTGQLTLPGPGMPPSIISGRMVASLLIKNLSKHG
ncbi:MAG: phytoene desaturase [Saprospiraceae bacterium]|nr:phytoene desaturase [Saprospiraceae bacterium]